MDLKKKLYGKALKRKEDRLNVGKV